MALSRTLDRVGLVLGGRYRLLAPIGTGASASVYLADDVTLRRRVAVKVLHEALAGDEAFLRRFQAEAQAAAALNHPHIMSVYDWGDTGEWPYLVMEHLGGGSLRAMLDHAGPLSVSQALVVGLETARGLDYAHRRGFVHRDIKPANLLFDDEARLRIGDFGLARALAEAAWTEPMGAVLGTARYASPEQARGESLDGRSDVYSLALVLIEAVTGAVPFRADTTIGTLMARVDRPLPVPEEMGALRHALEAAGRPDPAERSDAAQFGAALLAAAERLDRPAPLPLAGTGLAPGELPDPHPTDLQAEPSPRGPRGIVVPELDGDITGIVDLRSLHDAAGAALPPTTDAPADPAAADLPAGLGATGEAGAGTDDGELGPFNWQDDSDLGRAGRRQRRREERRTAADPPTGSPAAVFSHTDIVALEDLPHLAGTAVIEPVSTGGWFDDTDPGLRRSARAHAELGSRDGYDTRQRRWPRRLLVTVLVLAVLGGGGFAGWWYGVRIPSHAVPGWVGQQASAAERAAAANEWRVDRTTAYDDTAAAGLVLAQSPAAGADLEERQVVRLTVSLGPPPVAVPSDLPGRTYDEAGTALAQVGLEVGDVQRRFSEESEKGVVLALADGTPTQVPKGGSVGLVVSDGPEPRTIPGNLVGGESDAAVEALSALGLNPILDEAFSETVDKGVVMGVTPGQGEQADKGADVQVLVSKGPELVAVPPTRGLTVVEAADKIEAAGLVVKGTQGSPRRDVTGTDPPAGTMVRKGTEVTISTSGTTTSNDD